MKVRGLVVTIMCMLVAVLALSGAQAFASGHKFTRSLPVPTGGFKSPWGIAVGTAGELFVSNNASNMVDVYSPNGTFEVEFKVGAPTDKLRELAVDNSGEAGDTSQGDVYVADLTAGKIYRFRYDALTKIATGEGTPISTLPYAFAVNSKGDVFVDDYNGEEEPNFLDEYSPAGTLIKEILFVQRVEPATPYGMAINSGGTIYLYGEEGVQEYNESGACLNGCGRGFPGFENKVGGLAIGTEGNIYEAHFGLGEPKNQETWVYEPNGTEVEHFDPTHLIMEVHGLAVSGTTVFVTNTEGGEVAEYTEATAVKSPSEVVTDAASEVKASTAKLNGKLNPGGGATYYFEYGETACGASTCGTATAESPPVIGETQVSAAPTEITGLKAGTEYHYWVVAKNTAGTVHGAEIKFTTGALVTKYPLVLVKQAGRGEVGSSPAGIACNLACEESSHEFEAGETVTMTESGPAAGYEFAGWIGCKHATASTCKVVVTAATEVTAVFVRVGEKGGQGSQGATGPQGPTGNTGANGKEGAAGKTGATGAQGAVGAQGPAGPAGVQGPAGPAGQVELVTCKTVKKKGKSVQQCTSKLVSGTVKFTSKAAATQAKLSRRGSVYAIGAARIVHGRLSLRLTPLRRLPRGHYTLTLIAGSGSHETIHTDSFTLS